MQPCDLSYLLSIYIYHFNCIHDYSGPEVLLDLRRSETRG